MATTTVVTKKRRAWTTTVFVKQLMAISGLVFVAFLLFHSYGNLKMFLGPDAYNGYAQWLHEDAFVPIFPHGGFLMVFRLFMVLFLVVHMASAFVVWFRSKRARHTRYVVKKNITNSYAARTMRISGMVVFFLLVFHILQFTTHTINTWGSAPDTPYGHVIGTFQSPWMVVLYAVFAGAACLHVSHGFWSAFQSLGWVRANTRTFMIVLSGLIGGLIFVMFMAPPVAIAFGILS